MTARTLDPAELRVLGCLIEKQRTVPDQYPLSLNALRLACNQATNRDPVVDYDESEVRAAVQRLGTYGYSRLATGPGSRTAKYRQLFEEALGLLPSETAVLGMLMLRGPQTLNELKTRTERLYRFSDNAAVEATLAQLAERELAVLLPKRPGQREERWTHLLSDETAPSSPASASVDSTQSPFRPEPRPVDYGASASVDSTQSPVRPAERPWDDGAASGDGALELRLARVEAKLARLEQALDERGLLS